MIKNIIIFSLTAIIIYTNFFQKNQNSYLTQYDSIMKNLEQCFQKDNNFCFFNSPRAYTSYNKNSDKIKQLNNQKKECRKNCDRFKIQIKKLEAINKSILNQQTDYQKVIHLKNDLEKLIFKCNDQKLYKDFNFIFNRIDYYIYTVNITPASKKKDLLKYMHFDSTNNVFQKMITNKCFQGE